MAEHGEDVGAGLGVEVGEDRVAHVGDRRAHGASATAYPGIGGGHRPNERLGQLGLALHRCARPVQHVDHLLGRVVAPWRALGHTVAQPTGPLGHRCGQQVVLGGEVAVSASGSGSGALLSSARLGSVRSTCPLQDARPPA